ncbi:MAG: Flavin-dependent oxidoreductase, luciferase family, partial [Tardiphaga sp.]|nr:Flavin-dependent oxidoreductase, luciferase family [Tardiphaga sp.]
VGDMPHWKAVKNITLFDEEVIPRIRKLTSSTLQIAAE